MARKADLGEFEKLVLFSALRLGDGAFAPEIARVLEERTGREVSRGTLYGALDRLEQRGMLEWEKESATEVRSGARRKRFIVTPEGLRALAATRQVLRSMWEGLEGLLPEVGP